jgi:hypothetical protein
MCGEKRILNVWRGENTECMERRICGEGIVLNAWRGEGERILNA